MTIKLYKRDFNFEPIHAHFEHYSFEPIFIDFNSKDFFNLIFYSPFGIIKYFFTENYCVSPFRFENSKKEQISLDIFKSINIPGLSIDKDF